MPHDAERRQSLENLTGVEFPVLEKLKNADNLISVSCQIVPNLVYKFHVWFGIKRNLIERLATSRHHVWRAKFWSP